MNYSDADFDKFLVDATKQDSEHIDVKAQILIVQSIVSTALSEAGYINIQNDPQAFDEFKNIYIREVRQTQPDMTEAELEEYAHAAVIRAFQNEQVAILKIQMAVVANQSLAHDKPEQQNPTTLKKALYAELEVTYGYQKDHPIMIALNSLLDGEFVDPESEDMVPFIAQSIQIYEEREYQKLQLKAAIRSIMLNLGIEETNPEWNDMYLDISTLYLISTPYMHSPSLNRANLSSQLQVTATTALNPELRQAAIDLFTNY